jgi:putative sigma-54 modulation protein
MAVTPVVVSNVCRIAHSGGAMQLNVTGHHVDVTTSLKGYVERKLDRIVRPSDHVIDVHCILTVEKLRHKAEATVALTGATVYADATDPNMYAAIDALADKLDRRVKKHKEKLGNHYPTQAQKHAIT